MKVLITFDLKSTRILLFAIGIGLLSLLVSCGNNFGLKIGDQDVYAFGSEEPCNFITSNGFRVSWKSDPPVNIIITSSVPSEYDSEILKAADIWNSVKGQQLVHIYRDNSFKNDPGYDKVNAIYWMPDWDTDLSNQQARTSVRWDSSKLQDADIRINAKNFTFFKEGDESTAGKVHLQSLVLHELGHAVGLVHIEETASVMQAYLKSQTIRNKPGAVDTSSLSCEY
ncbi:MAG: matrixin family metalloprotease [Bdellovibrio sp.]|nr:matrixin family metalloprotease [Bdellovibrio sp.]